MTPPQRRATKDNRSRVVLAAVLAAIVLLGVVAILLSAGDDDDVGAGVEQYRPVEISGDPLPEFTDAATDAAAGKPIPEARGQTFDGADVSILRSGQPKILLFLSHSCPHCQAEVRNLTPWLEEGGLPDGVDLLSVSTNASESLPNWPPSAWLDDWPVPVLVDDEGGTAARAYGLPAFPYWVFVDADGNVVGRLTGELGEERVEEIATQLAEG